MTVPPPALGEGAGAFAAKSVPVGGIVKAKVEKVETFVEASKERFRCENSKSSCGQLDRQRKPIKLSRDLCHGGCISLTQLKTRADGTSAFNEERNCFRLADFGTSGPWRRNRKRRQRVVMLPGNA